jgi:hypothetical protein
VHRPLPAPVQIDVQVASSPHERNESSQRTFGVWKVVEHPYGQHQIERLLSKWESLRVSLDREDAGRQMPSCYVDGTADINCNDLCPLSVGFKAVPP